MCILSQDKVRIIFKMFFLLVIEYQIQKRKKIKIHSIKFDPEYYK